MQSTPFGAQSRTYWFRSARIPWTGLQPALEAVRGAGLRCTPRADRRTVQCRRGHVLARRLCTSRVSQNDLIETLT